MYPYQASRSLQHRAPQAFHGTQAGRNAPPASALRQGSFSIAAGNPPPSTDSLLGINNSNTNDAVKYAKPAGTITLGNGIHFHHGAVPVTSAPAFIKQAFLTDTLKRLADTHAPIAAQQSALLNQIFHEVVSLGSATTAVSEMAQWIDGELKKVDNFETGHFVDNDGHRHLGKLPANPTHRPDNLKYIEVTVVIDPSKSLEASVVGNEPTLQVMGCYKLLPQASPMLVDGVWTMPDTHQTKLDASHFTRAGYQTPKMDKKGHEMEVWGVDDIDDASRFIHGTYSGPVGLLDDQAVFDEVCGSNPCLYEVKASEYTPEGSLINATRVSVSPTTAGDVALYKEKLCHLVFIDQLSSRYIGHDAAQLTRDSLADQRHKIQRIQMSDHGSVNDYYQAFIKQADHLPSDPRLWELNLVTEFHGKLDELYKVKLDKKVDFQFPDTSSFRSSLDHFAAINYIKQHAEAEEKVHLQELSMMRQYLGLPSTSVAPPGTAPSQQVYDTRTMSSPSQAFVSQADHLVRFAPDEPFYRQQRGSMSFFGGSQAERAIASHMPRPQWNLSQFPFPPEHADSLIRYMDAPMCYCCFETTHSFRECPYRDDPDATQCFHANFAHGQALQIQRRGPNPGLSRNTSRYGPGPARNPPLSTRFDQAAINTNVNTSANANAHANSSSSPRNVDNTPAWRGLPASARPHAVYVLKSIIDDILLVANCHEYALQLFDCLCEAAVHFRLTFKLKKCDFFKDRLEWMGYDWTPNGNVPAQSKFDLIRQWALPKTSQALNSFVSFCGFYRNFLPWYEVEIGPLRKLARQYKHAPIPSTAWTPSLVELFDRFKAAITASPCLARADASKPFFLRTDWAKTGFAAILLQPDDSDASQAALACMDRGEPCVFDKTINGARLRPIKFLARKCDEIEEHYHSMVGEAACGRWGISKLRYYLWGRKFYWITDCSAIKAMIEYDGDNHLLRRWAMDLLGYSFDIIHRPERMMKDVDALSRHYDPLVRQHVLTAHRLREDAFASDPSSFVPVSLSRINAKGGLSNCAATVPSVVQVSAHVSLALTCSARTASRPASAHSFCTVLASRGKRAEARSIASNSETVRFRHVAMMLPIAALDTERDAFMPSDKAVLEACAFNFLQTAWISFNGSPASASSQLDTIAPACTLLLERNPERLALATMVSPQCVARLCPTISSILENPELLHGFPTVLGYDATFSPTDGAPEAWLAQQFVALQYLRARHSLRGFILFIPLPHDPVLGAAPRKTQLLTLVESQTARLPHWCAAVSVAAAHTTGDHVWRETVVIQGILLELTELPTVVAQSSEPSAVSPYSVFLDDYYDTLASPYDGASINHVSPVSISESSAPFAPSLLVFATNITTPILDPGYPACILPMCPDSPFSSSFAVPVVATNAATTYRPCAPSELFSMLSMEDPVRERVILLDHNQQVLILQACVGYNCLASLLHPFAEQLTRLVAQPVSSPSSALAFPATCLTVATQLPSPDDWRAAYAADPECSIIIDALAAGVPWTKQTLASVDPLFRPLLRENQVSFVNNRLICLKPVIRHQRALQLIIVPRSLRRRVFEAYHSTPCAGHMGDRKTFLRLRLRFLWPNMRRFVEHACKQCPECLLANAVHRPSSTLLHGTILEQPMALLHIDAYSPGATTSFHGGYTGLLTVVCDLTGFAVAVPFKKASASEFARLFCSEVLFKYGICSRVVIDDDSKFKGVFQDMCAALHMEHIVLARGNHQGCRCERLHRYLNKVLKIECTKRRTNRVFVDGSIVAIYAWNGMPIDGTDIVRSYVVCGRVFRFPIEVAMDALPDPVDDAALSLQRYLAGLRDDHELSQEIVKLLVDDRRTAHRESINESRTPRTFQVGDKVAIQVQVQSDASKGQVGKLVYDFKGPYVVVHAPGHDSYDVRRLDQPDGAIRHLKGSSLLPMPPKLEPCYPIDSIDYRFLNQDRAPVLNPLRDALGIDSYNYLWLDGEQPPDPSPDAPSPAIPAVVSARNPLAPSVAELYNELLHPSEAQLVPQQALDGERQSKRKRHSCHDDPSVCCCDPITLYEAIQRSTDRLFFVSFVAAGTIHPRLHIVRAEPLLSARSIESSNYKSSGIYYCEFLAHKQTDDKLPWNERRWRTEWRQYTVGVDGLPILSETRYEFPPQRIPDSAKYVAFASTLNLTDPSVFVYGPFDFENAGHTPSGKPKGRDRIPSRVWTRLKAVVEQRNDLEAPPLTLKESN